MFTISGNAITLNPLVGATYKGHSNVRASWQGFVDPVTEQGSKGLANRWGGHYTTNNTSQRGVLLRYEFDSNIEVVDYTLVHRSGQDSRANNIGIALYDSNDNLIGTPTYGKGMKTLDVKNVRAVELVIQERPQAHNQFNYFTMNIKK